MDNNFDTTQNNYDNCEPGNYDNTNVSYEEYSDSSNIPYAENFDNTYNEMPVVTPVVYTNYQEPVADSKESMCTAGLVLGIIGFFINPAGIVSILAIIFGAIGMNANGPKKNMGLAGLLLGIGSLIYQFLIDILITIFSFGLGGFSFCC